jgi:hypothetical protein
MRLVADGWAQRPDWHVSACVRPASAALSLIQVASRDGVLVDSETVRWGKVIYRARGFGVVMPL